MDRPHYCIVDTAWRTRTPIPPITESDGVTSVETAYAIQTHWTNMRLARGEKVVGRKIGLTSKAIQQQLGVSEPIYGTLWESSFYRAVDGRVKIPALVWRPAGQIVLSLRHAGGARPQPGGDWPLTAAPTGDRSRCSSLGRVA